MEKLSGLLLPESGIELAPKTTKNMDQSMSEETQNRRNPPLGRSPLVKYYIYIYINTSPRLLPYLGHWRTRLLPGTGPVWGNSTGLVV